MQDRIRGWTILTTKYNMMLEKKKKTISYMIFFIELYKLKHNSQLSEKGLCLPAFGGKVINIHRNYLSRIKNKIELQILVKVKLKLYIHYIRQNRLILTPQSDKGRPTTPLIRKVRHQPTPPPSLISKGLICALKYTLFLIP